MEQFLIALQQSTIAGWIVLIMLLVAMLVDWGTGLIKAFVNNSFKSRTSKNGILKKLGEILFYGLITVIGVVADITIIQIILLPALSTEIMSIWENIRDTKKGDENG